MLAPEATLWRGSVSTAGRYRFYRGLRISGQTTTWRLLLGCFLASVTHAEYYEPVRYPKLFSLTTIYFLHPITPRVSRHDPQKSYLIDGQVQIGENENVTDEISLTRDIQEIDPPNTPAVPPLLQTVMIHHRIKPSQLLAIAALVPSTFPACRDKLSYFDAVPSFSSLRLIPLTSPSANCTQIVMTSAPKMSLSLRAAR